MAYRIRITRRAKVDLMQTTNYLYEFVGVAQAKDWKDGLAAAVKSLSDMPRRCPLAPDSGEVEAEIRQLLFRSHRIVFSVNEVRKLLSVLRIYHTSREPLKPEDF